MHADDLGEYFETRAREEERLLSSHPDWSPKGLRDRLLARRKRRVKWLADECFDNDIIRGLLRRSPDFDLGTCSGCL